MMTRTRHCNPRASDGPCAPPTALAAYGIHPLPRRGAIVSNELIDRLRDEEGV
jgi:hypothetical protein